ncbi:uncharacterized protein LOC117589888 [Drosophila guanche]|uniref:uncharacterized protein LOC117589888 n=1 Tax=Drosophila guanche TaxID=7266 RepID=UPI001470BC18|nr:uncharacterized protein LOC117589888 [Drosophila guanche]
MQCRVFIALALLSLAKAAPSDPAPTVAVGVPLPESDKNHLCKFLKSFEETRMELFGVIMGINMVFISQAEQNFPNEFADYLNNRIREKNTSLSLWQRKFGVDREQMKLILQNDTVAQQWAKDHVFESHYLEMHLSLFTAIHAISQRTVDAANRMKSSLSEATVASEHEFFDKFNQYSNSGHFGLNALTDLVSTLESKFKNKIQCSKEVD